MGAHVKNAGPQIILLQNQERCKPIKKWLHIILRKWDSDSKNSKWIFKRKEFLKGVFGEKGFDFKIKGINF